MTADLYIIAAGKGSRMGGSLPKALVPITDEPCLTTTLKQVGSKFNNVFVITNTLIQNDWNYYFDHSPAMLMRNVINVPIKSGLGDGHAVLSGIMQVDQLEKDGKLECSNDIVVCWGDVFFQHYQIMDELLSRQLDCSAIIPAVMEDDPYVSLLVDGNFACMSADFSKYGEKHPTGFHDQSVFRFNRRMLEDALSSLNRCFWKNGRYITPGGELSLLHTFHYLYNAGIPAFVYETDYPTLSFNTPEEVKTIQEEINQKWLNQFS